ncbi:MAG TPA: acyltransferase [Puia sp.]|nr:acyltransferase [Puia sp.]
MNRIKILDSCRGLAALVVVFHHVYTRFGYLFPNLSQMKIYGLLNFISDLSVEAVFFFFLLSGFSIRLSLKEGMPVRKLSFNDYLYRRFRRILPLYFVALIFTFFCGMMIHAVDNPDYSARNLVGNLLFLQTPTAYKGYWFSPYGNNGPLWSLSFEMFYYLLFPPFIFLIMKVFRKENLGLKDQRMILCVAFALSLSCIVLNSLFFSPYVAFAKLFFIWYSGFFLANLYLEKGLKFDINFLLIAALTAASGLLLVLKRSDSLREFFAGSAMGTAFYLIAIMRNKWRTGFMTKLEAAFNFLFYQLGKGSYAFYLLHFPLILVLKSYANINIWTVILSLILLAYVCIRLEALFVKRKFRLFRLQYIR